MAERDYAFEALAEVTNTNWDAGRGELNAALKSIKLQCPIEDSYLLADEIHARGKFYREVMGEAILTPSALAKHWERVVDEWERLEKARRSAPVLGPPEPLPQSRREENLTEARKILEMFDV